MNFLLELEFAVTYDVSVMVRIYSIKNAFQYDLYYLLQWPLQDVCPVGGGGGRGSLSGGPPLVGTGNQAAQQEVASYTLVNRITDTHL